MRDINVSYCEIVINTLVRGFPGRLIDDLRQEAWIGILEAAVEHENHPEWGSWRNTIWRVAWWRIGKALHKRHDRPTNLFQVPCPDVLSLAARMDAETLMSRLDRETRVLVELRYWNGLTLDEIGIHAGITGEAVRQRLVHALKTMQKDRRLSCRLSP